MKTFSDLRESVVYKKKLSGMNVVIKKVRGKFVAFIDDVELDKYTTQRDAEKASNEFVKQYKA